MSMIVEDDVEIEPTANENEYLKEFRMLQETSSYKGQQWFGQRESLVEKYGWAVPNEEVLDYISNAFSRITEIGAGEGYWANELSKRDTMVYAFDPETDKTWYDVQTNHLSQVENYVTDNPVLMVWPPANDSLAEDMLACNPSHVLYVGEQRGGCTANDEFFDELTEDYKPVKKIDIPSYATVNDNFYHCVRKV